MKFRPLSEQLMINRSRAPKTAERAFGWPILGKSQAGFSLIPHAICAPLFHASIPATAVSHTKFHVPVSAGAGQEVPRAGPTAHGDAASDLAGSYRYHPQIFLDRSHNGRPSTGTG